MEKDDEDDDNPYSVLRVGMIAWHSTVYKRCYKSLSKGIRLMFGTYYKQIETGAVREQPKRLISDLRINLLDLSLNFNNVSYLEHSKFCSGNLEDEITLTHPYCLFAKEMIEVANEYLQSITKTS